MDETPRPTRAEAEREAAATLAAAKAGDPVAARKAVLARLAAAQEVALARDATRWDLEGVCAELGIDPSAVEARAAQLLDQPNDR